VRRRVMSVTTGRSQEGIPAAPNGRQPQLSWSRMGGSATQQWSGQCTMEVEVGYSNGRTMGKKRVRGEKNDR